MTPIYRRVIVPVMRAFLGRCRSIVLSTILLATLSGAGPTAVSDSPPGLPNWPVPVVAPFLSAEDAVKRMKLPAGFRMELVASEPLVEHPIAMSFDADGRAWVVEMRSYMPNVEGEGEKAPTGRISARHCCSRAWCAATTAACAPAGASWPRPAPAVARRPACPAAPRRLRRGRAPSAIRRRHGRAPRRSRGSATAGRC